MLDSVRALLMTRLFALSVVALAFAVTACERHPIPGQTAVTFTHGSGGDHGDGHGHGAADTGHGAAKHDASPKHEEKKAAHAPAAQSEEAPKFFPEKK